MSKSSYSAAFQKLLQQITMLLTDKKHVVVVLDGRSGVGKSTIAGTLAKELDAVVVHCDNFYAGAPEGIERNWLKKTHQEKIEQVFDWQRLRNVLKQLIAGKAAQYYPFNFDTGNGLSEELIYLKPAPLIILDGVYTAKMFKDLIDIVVLVEFPDENRRKRLIKREGEKFMQEWHSIWDSTEDYYFTEVQPTEKFDHVLIGKVE